MSPRFTKRLISFLVATVVVFNAFAMPVSASSTSDTSSKTGIGLAEFVVQAYDDGWKYSYGAFGQLNSNGVRKSDCSGLIFAYLCWDDESSKVVANYSMPRTVSTQVAASSESGSVSDIPRTHGLLLTVAGNTHVGVYIGNDQSIDNSTYGTNMVLRTVSEYKWVKWYKLDCIDYPTTGWYEFNGTPFYYLEGQYVINATLNIGNQTYTFDSEGTPSPMPDESLYMTTSYDTTQELSYPASDKYQIEVVLN